MTDWTDHAVLACHTCGETYGVGPYLTRCGRLVALCPCCPSTPIPAPAVIDLTFLED